MLPRMSFFISLALSLGLASHGLVAQDKQSPESAEHAVQRVVDRLFDGMRAKDAQALLKLFLPDARLGTSGVNDWVDQVSKSNAFLDEVTYDEVILIDEGLAMAWTPYTLYVDGELHHCGVDVFVMRLGAAGWKILQLDDTRRTDDCPNPNAKAKY